MCWKRTCKRRSETTGGLRPPLLRCCANVRRRKKDFCAAQTQVQPRAAGVSPPWFSEPNVVRPESRNVRRLANTESRAAGVSPPWFDNTIGTAADFFGLNTFLHRTFGSPHHGGLTPPALALLCECPPAKNDFCGAQTQVQPRAAGVSPPWFDNAIGTAADFFGLNTFLHRTFGFPHHGGLTPPALGCAHACRRR
jgi:hypothetical protein